MELISYAVPVFVVSMLLEAIMTWRRRLPVYNWQDTFSSLACGMGSQLVGLYIAVIVLGTYAFVFDHARIHTFEMSSLLGWTLAIVGVDFLYYFWHRVSHVSNLFWASHVVHHQSEEYNLSTALRQSWFGGITAWVFYMPLAVLGVPPAMYVASYSINLLYQYVLHTKVIKSLGPLEWIMNTPSHHRVHHGTNRLYLDRNFGGIFIIWDLWFGTFQKEEEEPRYGLVKPLHSWNPLWANIATWCEIWTASRQMARLRDKLLVWVKNPGWQPGDKSLEDAANRAAVIPYKKFPLVGSRDSIAYIGLQLSGTLAAMVAVMSFSKIIPTFALVWMYAATISGMLLWDPLLLGKVWAWRAETVRNAAVLGTGMAVASSLAPSVWTLAAVGIYLVLCLVWGLVAMRRAQQVPPSAPKLANQPADEQKSA